MRLINDIYMSEDGKRRIRTFQDQFAESPRENDNLGTMVCFHSRYELGDEQPKCGGFEYLLRLAEEVKEGITERIDAYCERLNDRMHPVTSRDWDEYDRLARSYKTERVEAVISKHYITLPLVLHDHSGLSMSTSVSCPWDSSNVGFIYVSKQEVRDEYGWINITAKREREIQQRLRAEIEEYSDFLAGSVYAYVCETLMPCPEGWDAEEWAEHDCHWDAVDSCAGFIGSDVILNGLAGNLGDEWLAVFCESEGITVEQLRKEENDALTTTM